MNKLLILANSTSPIIVLLIILGIAGVIAIVAFIVYRLLHPKLKKDEEIDENEALQQELDRVLEPVEDEEIKKAIEEYKDEEDN